MTPKVLAARITALHNAEIRRQEIFYPDLRAVLAREQLRGDRPKPSLPKLKSLEQEDVH